MVKHKHCPCAAIHCAQGVSCNVPKREGDSNQSFIRAPPVTPHPRIPSLARHVRVKHSFLMHSVDSPRQCPVLIYCQAFSSIDSTPPAPDPCLRSFDTSTRTRAINHILLLLIPFPTTSYSQTLCPFIHRLFSPLDLHSLSIRPLLFFLTPSVTCPHSLRPLLPLL